MFLLLMKPTGQVDFGFDAGLMVCLRDDREDGDLQVPFEGSLRWQLAVEGAQSLLLLAIQIQNEHSIEDLLNFLIVFLISVLLKPSPCNYIEYEGFVTSKYSSIVTINHSGILNRGHYWASIKDLHSLLMRWLLMLKKILSPILHHSLFFAANFFQDLPKIKGFCHFQHCLWVWRSDI